ncbi:hypothetical protein, partial [Xanthomonas oryzae]|uniref:hypothetical protein n=1 Tax=Xanthomonas oryzae TaxID=347 RepID=UPI001C4DD597
RGRSGDLSSQGQQQNEEQTREPGHGTSYAMDEPVACAAGRAATIGEPPAMNAGYAARSGQEIAHSVSLQRNSRTRRIALHTLLTPRSYTHGP